MKKLLILSLIFATPLAFAQKSKEEIAKELSNPAAPIINLPLQQNWDYGGGPNDNAQHWYLQIQPVIPFKINNDWNVISRTVALFENKHNGYEETSTGLGDITETIWLSPKLSKGLILGFGAVAQLPTSSEEFLGSHKWGAGPSMIIAQQTKLLTFGMLASQTWSFAGNDKYEDLNKTFLQPFFAFHLPDAYTITLSSEYTYDWETEEEVFPLNLMLAKVVKIGKMPVSLSFGGRYYADKPTGGPDWGLRGMITLVLPE